MLNDQRKEGLVFKFWRLTFLKKPFNPATPAT